MFASFRSKWFFSTAFLRFVSRLLVMFPTIIYWLFKRKDETWSWRFFSSSVKIRNTIPEEITFFLKSFLIHRTVYFYIFSSSAISLKRILRPQISILYTFASVLLCLSCWCLASYCTFSRPSTNSVCHSNTSCLQWMLNINHFNRDDTSLTLFQLSHIKLY